MDLLSSGQRAQITAAIKNVTDTFFQVPVVYTITGGSTTAGSIDRFQEDRTVIGKSNYNLLGQVKRKDGSDTDFGKELSTGMIDAAEVKVTFNYADLAALSLVDNVNNVPLFVEGSDYFYVQGKSYIVIFVGVSGNMSAVPMLAYVYGKSRS